MKRRSNTPSGKCSNSPTKRFTRAYKEYIVYLADFILFGVVTPKPRFCRVDESSQDRTYIVGAKKVRSSVDSGAKDSDSVASYINNDVEIRFSSIGEMRAFAEWVHARADVYEYD